MDNVNVKALNETVDFLKTKITDKPRVGIVLGSGLGGLVDMVSIKQEIPYADIPNFPVSTVKGHGGKLIFGMLNDVAVVLLSGRFHYYEGYDMQEVTLPVRVMKMLGADTLMVSNAARLVLPLAFGPLSAALGIAAVFWSNIGILAGAAVLTGRLPRARIQNAGQVAQSGS